MISVVVPVYNEEEIIPLLHDAVVRAMSKLRDTWEVVYVNDGSTDSTLQLLRNLQQGTPRHHIRLFIFTVVLILRRWGITFCFIPKQKSRTSRGRLQI